MTMGERLRDARKSAGYTQRELAALIGAKHNSVSNWEKGQNHPDPVTLERLCRALRTTPNFLLLGLDTGAAATPDLTAEERDVLASYRKLGLTARGAVRALLAFYTAAEAPAPRQVAESVSAAPPPALSVLPGRLSIQAVAAGTGTYLDDDMFQEITVAENALTRKAAFYVPVEGDSMEPRYHNGDILIVQEAVVEIGEIGIFTLDGHGYVKIRSGDSLLSLNKAYAPIPMGDDIVCNGKVIGVLEPSWLMEQSV